MGRLRAGEEDGEGGQYGQERSEAENGKGPPW
jgi:hypothetical protein